MSLSENLMILLIVS